MGSARERLSQLVCKLARNRNDFTLDISQIFTKACPSGMYPPSRLMFANLRHESQENTHNAMYNSCKFHTFPEGRATAELDTSVPDVVTSRQPARAPEKCVEQNIRTSEKNTNRGLKNYLTRRFATCQLQRILGEQIGECLDGLGMLNA